MDKIIQPHIHQIAIVATTLGIIQDIPTIRQVMKTHNVGSFSTTSLLISTIGIVLWAIYYKEQTGLLSIPMIGLTWSLMVNIFLLYNIKKHKQDKKNT